MKHKSNHKHFKRLKKKYRRLAMAVAGAALLTTAALPGMPVAIAHASANPNNANSNITASQQHKHPNTPQLKVHNKIAAKARPAQDAKQQRINQTVAQPKLSNKVAPMTKQAPEKQSLTKPSAPATIGDKTQAPDLQAPSDKDQAVKQQQPQVDKAEKTKQETAKADAPSPAAQQESKVPANYQEVLNVTATAYAPGPHDNDQWGNKTHLGTQIRPGVIAVDPDVIPLGSRVYIQYPDGRGVYAVAEDTGGAIKGNRIDVAMSSVEEAKDFGMQNVKVYILDKGKNA